MKICIECHARFDTVEWQCPSCAFTPDFMNSYPAFSPALAFENEGFKPDYFAELARLEEKNFWFTGRNHLIIWALQRYFPTLNHFLEIGCGTGFVLSGIAKAFPHINLYGSEIYSLGLTQTALRLKNATLLQIDARSIPFENEFDVIGAFDILEHIEEDELVLKQMYQAVRPKGGIILSVPQHHFLWSAQDEHACHVRRYSAHDLKSKVNRAGFKVVKTTSFISLLLPFMMITRYFKRKAATENYDVLAELKLPSWLNSAFAKVLNLEHNLIRSGIPFPFGGSLLIVAQKI